MSRFRSSAGTASGWGRRRSVFQNGAPYAGNLHHARYMQDVGQQVCAHAPAAPREQRFENGIEGEQRAYGDGVMRLVGPGSVLHYELKALLEIVFKLCFRPLPFVRCGCRTSMCMRARCRGVWRSLPKAGHRHARTCAVILRVHLRHRQRGQQTFQQVLARLPVARNAPQAAEQAHGAPQRVPCARQMHTCANQPEGASNALAPVS